MRPGASRPAGAVQWGGIRRARRRSPPRRWRGAGAGGSGVGPLQPTQRGGCRQKSRRLRRTPLAPAVAP
eukprot:7663161-Lingulodinium_polyedra.AAC.1